LIVQEQSNYRMIEHSNIEIEQHYFKTSVSWYSNWQLELCLTDLWSILRHVLEPVLNFSWLTTGSSGLAEF